MEKAEINKNNDELFLWDGINGGLNEIESIKEGEEIIRETYIEGGDIHPDIESVFIVKKVAFVHVEESEELTELNGCMVPVCKVSINSCRNVFPLDPNKIKTPEQILQQNGWWPSHDEQHLNSRIPTKYVLNFIEEYSSQFYPHKLFSIDWELFEKEFDSFSGNYFEEFAEEPAAKSCFLWMRDNFVKFIEK